jgi:hypothetical protein
LNRLVGHQGLPGAYSLCGHPRLSARRGSRLARHGRCLGRHGVLRRLTVGAPRCRPCASCFPVPGRRRAGDAFVLGRSARSCR